MRVVILGNGIAGYSAAEMIRKEDSSAEIVMISEEASSTYLRPLLSKTYIRAFQKEKICVQDEPWYLNNQIRQVLGRTVKGIDLEAREIILDCEGSLGTAEAPKKTASADETVNTEELAILGEAERITYDCLIYALGADGVIPPFAGREKKGVMTVRSFRDFDQVRRRMYLAKQAVVIGGGVIGLEMAWELKQMGLSVAILEAGPRLMGRILDENSGEVLKQKITEQNVIVETGVQISEITGGAEVSGVRLSDGRFYPAELVVISCGVRADLAPAKEAGISCERGVLVNSFLQTSHKDVYAAGDCIQCEGQAANPALWGYAKLSGGVAGYNVCHPEEPKRFQPSADPVILNVFGFSICSLGDVTGEVMGETEEKKEIMMEDSENFRICVPNGIDWKYERRFCRDGILSGVVLMGDLRKMETYRKLLASGQKGQEKG